MKPTEIISLVTGIVGAVLGSVGIALSTLSYLRDRPRLKVTLQWDMAIMGQPDVLIGIVSVANVGRRPTFLTMVSLQVPRINNVDHLVLLDSVAGRKLEEGGAPIPFQVTYEGMELYGSTWNKIRAVAQDSAGKKYYSPYTKKKA